MGSPMPEESSGTSCMEACAAQPQPVHQLEGRGASLGTAPSPHTAQQGFTWAIWAPEPLTRILTTTQPGGSPSACGHMHEAHWLAFRGPRASWLRAKGWFSPWPSDTSALIKGNRN